MNCHHFEWENSRFQWPLSIASWWFGTCFIFPEILGMSSSQLTNSYFFRGVDSNHQPDSKLLVIIRLGKPPLSYGFPMVGRGLPHHKALWRVAIRRKSRWLSGGSRCWTRDAVLGGVELCCENRRCVFGGKDMKHGGCNGRNGGFNERRIWKLPI